MIKCKICHDKTRLIMDFGKKPIANKLIKNLAEPEFFYNLAAVFCPSCRLVQLAETVSPSIMFNDHYQFISSTSQKMAKHFKKAAQEIMRKIAEKKNPLVVEVGSNDGIMLKHLAARGIRHLGVDPAGNVNKLARQHKVKVVKKFFNRQTALEIKKQYGQADIIFGANVFTHIEDIKSVFQGIEILLKKDGLLIIEDPYLVDIISQCAFDQIYDEHIYFFSGLSMNRLAKRYRLQLVDMKHKAVHGGSMRYYLSKSNVKCQMSNVTEWIDKEKELKLDKIGGYVSFEKRVKTICQNLKKMLTKIKQNGKQIVGYGLTAKSATLLNYAKIGPGILDYISDNTPGKIGKYSPGVHIPIKSHRAFIKDQPDFTLLLAWNHREEIFAKEKIYRQTGGKFIIYFPKVTIE